MKEPASVERGKDPDEDFLWFGIDRTQRNRAGAAAAWICRRDFYEVRGRQFIVLCAAEQAGLTTVTQTPVRGAYVALALPQ